ncbi:MAG: hypothetical protein K9G49_04305 [Taibaiella sp.]|nr:hypothetical protein [Taibaiella sp.]
MAEYKLAITPRAVNDIQNAVNYYNSKQGGLGKKYYNDVSKQIASIIKAPFSRAIRYDDIRFGVLDKFPFAIHYNIDENMVIIQGVISMYMNPETSWIVR